MRTSQDLAKEIIDRQGRSATDRSNWEMQWLEIARRIFPNYVNSFSTQGQDLSGQFDTSQMVDSTGTLALTRFAAAMESMLTPRNSLWHRLGPSDKRLLKDRATRLWFDDAAERLFQYRYAPKANFASQKHEDYMCLGAFGTGCLFIDALQDPIRHEKGIRYAAIHLGEIYFLENHQGIIDTAMRKFKLTARQAMQRFEKSGLLPEDIINAAGDPKKQDTPFWFIHCVSPRSEADGYNEKRVDVMGMPYASWYVSVTGQDIVHEGGFHTFPYAISRYVIAPGEIYGRSPAMLALPSIKTLNEQKLTVLKQGHRIVDPVLLAHDDGVLDTLSAKPGDVNYGGVSADGKPLVHVLPTGNLSLAKEMMEAERSVINDFFLVTLFQILVDTPTMTATEVLERAREKGALLSPTMGRQQSESLGPMIDRELDLLMQQGLLPPLPMALQEAKGQYTVQYDSPLSRMAKAENVAGLFRTVDWMREYIAITQDPSPLDRLDWDAAMPDIMDTQAVPGKWLKSDEAMAEQRKQRADAAQQKQMMDAAPAITAAMKNAQAAGGGGASPNGGMPR